MGSGSCILFTTPFSSSCLSSCSSGMLVAFSWQAFHLLLTLSLWLANFLTLSLWLGFALTLIACCLLFMPICC